MSEELIATNEGGGHLDLPPNPTGPQGGICIDVIDRGSIKQFNHFQNKEEIVRKVTLRFFCGHYHTIDGKDYALWIDKWFRLSMHEKSALRKFIGQWRGKPVTDAEAKRFNVAGLLWAPALLQVSHNVKPDKTYANIDSIMAPLPGMPVPTVPTDYVRVKDRPPRESRQDGGLDAMAHANRKDQRQMAPASSPFSPDDDDLPF